MLKVSSKDHQSELKRINYRFRYGINTVRDYGKVKEFERFCLIDRRLSQDSAVHYCNTIFRLLMHSQKPIARLVKDDIRDFLAIFSNNHTYRNNLKGIRVFFRDFLRKPELIDTFRFPRSELQPKILPSKQQLRKFYDLLDYDHERVLFLLYASSGLRRSEVLDLRINQLDQEQRAIIPLHTSTQKKSWISFYNEEADDLLSEYLKSQKPEDKLFKLSSERKYLLFHKARLESGADITPQVLRFWFANEMARLGTPDRFIDAFQGRIPRSILARHYTDYSLESLKQIYDKAGIKVLA